MNAAEYIANKVPVPGEMLTRDWARVRVEVRERAIFMAGVARLEVLQLARDVARREAAGELSRLESRRELREGLARLGYVPPPGTGGTIKDVRTARRMNVMLDTQLGLAQGQAAYAKQWAARVAYPYRQMIRVERRKRERNWQARWGDVAGVDAEGVIDVEKMIAPLGHPVWVALSRFGQPWPIFDFGSGMGVRSVGAREAKAAGLPVPVPESAQGMERGLNEGLAAVPEVREERLRAMLITDLKGTAEWDPERPGVLRFLDPDGTTARTAQRLREIWDGVAAGYRIRQREALEYWQETGRPAAGSDHQYHLMRLLRRLGWRGEKLPEDELPEVVDPLMLTQRRGDAET